MSENMWNNVSKAEVERLRAELAQAAESDSMRAELAAERAAREAGAVNAVVLLAEIERLRAENAKAAEVYQAAIRERNEAEADAAAMKEVVAKWVYVTITGHRYLSDDHGEVLKTVEESTAGAALLERLAAAEQERDALKARIGELQEVRDDNQGHAERLMSEEEFAALRSKGER